MLHKDENYSVKLQKYFCNGTVNSNLLIQIFAVKPTHFLNLMKKSQNVAIRMQSSTTLSYVIL